MAVLITWQWITIKKRNWFVENSPCHVVWVENNQIPSSPQAVELVMVENQVAICSAELSIIIYY